MRVKSISPRVPELIFIHNKVLHTKDSASRCTKTSYSEEDINSFYNDVDDNLGKPSQYTIEMGHFDAQMGKSTNRKETAMGKFGHELRNERGDSLVECATSKKYKIINTIFQKKAGRRWTWKSPNDVTKTEIDYILTNRPDVITNVTVFNKDDIGSDVVKLDVEVERKEIMTKNPPRVDTTQIGSKKFECQLEPNRGPTKTRRHRHHERNHHRYDPTKRDKNN